MPDEREFQSVVDEAEQAARAGDFARADRHLRDALRLQEASLGVDHHELASTLNNLAVVSEMLGRFDEAERCYRRANAIASGALPLSDPLVVTSRDNLRDFCAARGLPLEDWPGIGQEAESPRAPTPTARAAAPAPVTPSRDTTPETPERPRRRRIAGGLLAVAALGAMVVVASWRTTPASPPPAMTTPARESTASAATDAPVAPTVSPSPAAAAPQPERPPPSRPEVSPPTAQREVSPQAAVPPARSATTPAAPAGPSTAALPEGVRVVSADVCASLSTGGAWRCEPLGDTPGPGRASYYTRIASPRPLRLEHRWYQGTALRQQVPLAVGASPSAGYRTFSRQTLTAGTWRVELRTADGTVLHEATFDIR